ncbi:MAG: universal stress protein [Vicingaceae bacterium]
MKRKIDINKILIPLDFSETSKVALEHGANLCAKFNADLHLLHVFTPMSSDVFPMLDVASQIQEVKQSARKELEKLSKDFADQYGVKVSIELRDGNPTKEIVKVAKEVEADMIVMGTHGASGIEEFFLGSNAYRVVTSASVPVFTIQKHATKYGYQRIALPIDSSIHTRDKVSEAVYMAKHFGATIHIAALITEEHEDEKSKFNLKVKQIEEHLENQGISYLTTEKHGDNIAEMTMEHAKEVDADLIMIMTEQEAATGLFVGPYAQQIVNHSKIPVISVTPYETVTSFGRDQLAGDYRPFYI